MFENDFMVEFNDEELGECRTYIKNFKGYEQAIKDLKLYKAKQNQRIVELEEQLKKSLESNNDLLKQIIELQSQLIVERLKGENK